MNFNPDCPVDKMIDALGLWQINDQGKIEQIADAVLANATPKTIAECRAGKDKAFNAMVGQAVRVTGCRVNPERLGEVLKAKLSA